MSHEVSAPITVFLGGPFSAAQARDRSGRLLFRDKKLRGRLLEFMGAMHSAGLSVLNAHLTEKWGDVPPPDTMVHRDFGWIERCDLYVAFLPNDARGLPYRTDGTFMELGYAIAMKKNALVLMDDPASPAWSTFVSKLLCTSLIARASPEEFLADPAAIVKRSLDPRDGNQLHPLPGHGSSLST